MQADPLSGGFSSPAIGSAVAFRAVMDAMARPGRIHTLAGAAPPTPISLAAGVVILTLCDGDTPLCLRGAADCDDVRQWIAFHTGAPPAPAEEADFVLGSWDDLIPLSQYRIGTPDYPDRSATLIVEMPTLTAEGAVLTGPGIKDRAQLSLPDRAAFQANHGLFPMGLDFILTCGTQVAALPRSTEVF